MVHSPILLLKRLRPRGFQFQFCLSMGKPFSSGKYPWVGGFEEAFSGCLGFGHGWHLSAFLDTV